MEGYPAGFLLAGQLPVGNLPAQSCSPENCPRWVKLRGNFLRVNFRGQFSAGKYFGGQLSAGKNPNHNFDRTSSLGQKVCLILALVYKSGHFWQPQRK